MKSFSRFYTTPLQLFLEAFSFESDSGPRSLSVKYAQPAMAALLVLSVFSGYRTSGCVPKKQGRWGSTNLNLRFGVIAACTLTTPSTDGTIPLRNLNPSFEDVRIPRRTILGRWFHLRKQTVITDGTASSVLPTTAPLPQCSSFFSIGRSSLAAR